MEAQLNADDLAKIMSNQVRILSGEEVNADDIKVADSIANQIGKMTKLAGLQMAYAVHVKQGGSKIGTLESGK